MGGREGGMDWREGDEFKGGEKLTCNYCTPLVSIPDSTFS